MKITLKQKTEHRLTITLDDEPWREIHTAVFGKNPSFPQCDTKGEWEARFKELEFRAGYSYACKRLGLKAFLKTDLKAALNERLISDETIRKVLLECERHGYLNDHDWVFSYVESCKRRNVGPRMIEQKLRLKGAPEKLIEEALRVLDDDDKRREQIHTLLTTRYRNRDLTQYLEREKVIAALVRKGYIASEIRDVIETLTVSP